MKHIVLTFDDGRIDSYENAYAVMKKYGIRATMFVTTGYVDGTWKEGNWASARRSMQVQHIGEMYENGFEIALHGDKHITEKSDFGLALSKLKSWGIDTDKIGFSIPNSDVSVSDINEIKEVYKECLAYIRGGRRCDTKNILNRILYVVYTLTKSPLIFRLFNRKNIILKNEIKNVFDDFIPSVVVKKGDTYGQLMTLLDKMPDESICVLMLHSILDKNDPYYGKDSWCWDTDSFEKLLGFISNNENIDVKTLKEIWESLYE